MKINRTLVFCFTALYALVGMADLTGFNIDGGRYDNKGETFSGIGIMSSPTTGTFNVVISPGSPINGPLYCKGTVTLRRLEDEDAIRAEYNVPCKGHDNRTLVGKFILQDGRLDAKSYGHDETGTFNFFVTARMQY